LETRCGATSSGATVGTDVDDGVFQGRVEKNDRIASCRFQLYGPESRLTRPVVATLLIERLWQVLCSRAKNWYFRAKLSNALKASSP